MKLSSWSGTHFSGEEERDLSCLFLYLLQKKWYFRHEWISSQDVFESMLRFHCKNWSFEGNEADAKSFFRVEIFFFQSEGHRTHCWKNGCSRDQQKLNFSCPEVVKSEFDLQNLGCESYLRCGSSSSKAGLYFVKSRLLGGRLYKQGSFFWWIFLKSVNARAVNCSKNSSETI